MRALVTGGNGFIGAHLCRRLLADHNEVRVLARPTANLDALEGLRVDLVRGDVTDPASLRAAVQGVDWVFHLAAALKGFREADLFRVNADGARNLAEACLSHAAGLRRLIVVSSLAAAGPSPGGRTPLAEEAPERPVTWYGRSKLAGDRAVQAARELPSVIIRPPIVFGPREPDLFTFFRIVGSGFIPVVGRVERCFSLVFVADLADALIRAARTATAPGSVFFITGPEVVTSSELGRLIASALGVEPRTLRVPEAAVRAAGRLADWAARLRGRPNIFSSQKVVEMCQPAWVADPGKAARELGWTAPTALHEALARTAVWYRDNGWL